MKHAYLIMAHNNFTVLEVFLKMIDDKNNDIYIHIDKSVKNWNNQKLSNITSNSKIFFVDRVDVKWSTYSHIEAMINLFQEATKTYHDYYHMLSGADLPIKSIKEINLFFQKNQGNEFIGFSKTYKKENACQKNYFVQYFRNNNKIITLLAKYSRNLLIRIQKQLNINQCKKYKGTIKKGADWFSITHPAVNYIIKEEKNFGRIFDKAFCPSEFLVQTILYNSHFKENIFDLDDENKGSQRYIDWERGSPYVFKIEDFDLLIKSDLLFARKFMENEDFEIVKKIYEYIINKEQV